MSINCLIKDKLISSGIIGYCKPARRRYCIRYNVQIHRFWFNCDITSIIDGKQFAGGIHAGVSIPLLNFDAQSISFYIIQRRSEEHTSELQSRFDLVCRLLLEKKKK